MLPPHLHRQHQKELRRQAILNQGIPPDADDYDLRQIACRRRDRLIARAVGRKQNELERIYRGYSTRMLLSRLHDLRNYDPDVDRTAAELIDRDAEEWALRKVLASRPHVMRKREGMLHRAKVARRQHGQGKSRNR